ncbi:hypothetical protein FDJ70_07375 [Clostridium botulinum]|nr:hypothetical protein [Clostridium botulinum]
METIGTSLKTIFAKFQQVKKDTGEVNKDFSATINTLEKMGVETGSMAGQLKPVGEILQELANKWNDMNDKQKAMVSSSLGVYQISRFSALMQGLAKDVNGVSRSQQIYSEVMKASGETNKQYETYLNSLSGAIDKFKAKWEVVFNNSMNSSTLKSIVNIGTGILNLVDKFGGLNIALVSLGTVLLSSNNKFKSFKNSLFSIKATEDGLSHSILINGKSLQELKLAFTSASAGGGVFKGTLNMLKTGLTGLKLKAIGAKIAVEGLKMALTLGLSVAITFALEGIMKLINKSSELKQKNQELQQSVQQNIKSNNDMITYLRTEGKEYDNLSKKTKLTTEEQEKLKSIKQQLVDKFPELVKGINSETGEMELQKKSTKELIELLKQKNKLESNKLISGGNDFLKDKQKEYREIQKEIQKFQRQAEMLKNGGGNIDKTGANYRHTIDGLNEIKRTIGLTKAQQEELDRKTEEYKNILAQVGTKVEEQKQKYSELKPYVQAVFDAKNLDSFQQKLANIRIDPSKFLKDGKLDFTSLEVEIQKFKDSIEKDPNYSNIKMVVSLKDPKADDLKKYFNSILALSKTLKMSPLELTKIMPLSVNKEYLKKNSDLFVKILKDEIKRASGQDKVDLTQMLKGFDTKEVAKQNAQVAESTYLLNQKQEDLNETYKNAINSAKDYNKYMKEMTENGHLSAESVGEINEKHSDLIPLLGDEKELYKHLESASKHERDVALNAISSKLEGNSTFCKNVVANHKTAFDSIAQTYNVDLSNFETVATAKSRINTILCNRLTSDWLKTYGSIGSAMGALKTNMTSSFLAYKGGDNDGEEYLSLKNDYAQLQGLTKGVEIIQNEINQAKNKISKSTLNPIDFRGMGTRVGGGGGRHSSGGGRSRHSSGGSGRHKSSSSGSHKSETQYAYDGKAENIYDATIKTINNSLEKSDKLIDTISQKIANLQSLESKSNFKDILTQENEKLDAQRVKLDKLKSAQSQAESMKEQLKQKFYSNWSWMKGRDLESMSENEWMSLYNKYYGQTLNFGTGDGAKKKEEAYKKGAELFKELKKNYEDASNLAIESADKELKLEQEINTAIKERIEIQTRMFNEEEERYSKRVSYSEYLKDVFNKTDEDRMKYTKQILEVNKDYQDNLYDHLNTIMAQRDSLERNTAEWNILNQQIGEYQQKLIDTSKSIEDQKQAIKDLEWETQIKKYTELFNNLQDKIGDTHDKLEILMGTNSNDYTGRIKLMDEELTNSIEYNAQLRITNHQLQSQLSKLKKGTDEWTKVHDKIEEYNESIDASTKSILDQQKAIGNLQWETQLKRYTDVLDSKKNDIDDLQAKLDITNAKDRNDIGTRLALMESILSANRTYLKQTESLKNNLVKQRDELQVGSSEWEKINNKVKEYDNNIRNTSKTIAQHNSEILKLKWDFKIKQYTQLLNVRKDTMSDLQNELDIVNTKDEKNYLKKLAHMDKILQINNDLLKKNTSLRDELIKQRDELEKGSADWELINNKVKEYDNNINQATKSITQQNKAIEDLVKSRIRTLLEIQKENQERQLDKDIFQMPETEWNEYHQKKIERIKREIDETNEFVNKYGKNQYTDDELSAKNLELEQVEAETYGDIKNYQSVFEDIHNQRIQAIDDELKKLDEKNEKEKIAEEREKRRLDLEKLKIELENTRNQKNIQQLTKDDNGLYQFVYVADQKKVDDLEQQIKDKEEDNAKWEQDLQDQEYRKKLDKEKKFEDDMIKSKQAFHTKEHNKLQEHYQDMDRLVEAYLSELKEEYGNHYEKMLALLEVQIDKEKKIQENYQTVSFDLLKAYFYSIIQETQQNHKAEIEEKEKYYDKQIENLNKYCDDKIKKVDNQCKEEQDKLKEHHDNEANTISEHYKNLNGIVDVNMEDLKSIYSKKWDDILNILKDKVSKAEELNKQLQIQQVEAEKYSYEQAKKDLLKAKENNDEIEAQKVRDRYAKYGVDDSHNGGYSYDDAEDDFLKAKERGDESSADEVRKKYNGSSSSHSSSHSSSDDDDDDDDDSSSSHSSRPSVSSDDEDSFLDAKERGDEGDADRIREKYSSFDTGGYTGDWGDNGKLAILHEKELILNKSQTEDILNTVRLLQQYNPLNNIKSQGINLLPSTSELKVHDKQPQIIKNEYRFEKAEFPNVTNDSGVQNLLDNLNRLSKQYSPN